MTTTESPAEMQVRVHAHLEAQRLGREWTGLITREALSDLCDLLGVSEPVTVDFNLRCTRRRGTHGHGAAGHVFTFGRGHTVKSANVTLIHELTHAAQQEQAGSRQAFMDAYHTATRRTGYRANPYEIEARATAALFADDVQITR